MTKKKQFLRRMSRGRKFEKWEMARWLEGIEETDLFETPANWKGKQGRVDIRIDIPENHQIVVIEIKASDWDKMKPHRVRPNALRHVRQVWRYIEAYVSPRDVIPALVYPSTPKISGRKEEIEAILDENSIAAVWRDEYEEDI
jgi:hypothetical protein